MKLRTVVLCALFLTVAIVAAAPTVQAVGCAGANRFWVGGTGVWSSTTKWSASSGGASGASVPDSTNPVFFDANSGLGTATVDVTASACDVIGTAMSLTTVSLGSQTWRIFGDVTDMEGAKITIGTSTLELAGTTTQTIGLGVSTSNFNVYNLLVSGAGTKVVNNRFYVQGATWSATTTVTMQFKPDLAKTTAAVFTLQAGFLIAATSGNVLTMQSKTAGSRWALSPTDGGTARLNLLRVSIQDASASTGTFPFVDATDYTDTDLGNNANVAFTPRSRQTDTQVSPALSIDYGPQVYRNLKGDLIATYSDGSVNNGNWYVTYSTDNGQTWAARTTLMSPTSGGILTASTGAGQEVYGYVDKRDVLHIVNHKLLSGATHVIYTRVDISSASNVASFENWNSAFGRHPPSQGNAVDGQGYDDLGAGSDASLAILSDGTIAFGIDTASGATGPMAVQFFLPKANSYTARTTLSFSGTVQDVALIVSDPHDNLHFFADSTIGGVLGIAYLRCDDAVHSDCTRAANWNGAAGGATNDQVIFSASGNFGFPFAVVDSEGIVHVASSSQFLVASFCRIWHNFLIPGSTTWSNGIGAAGGAEINAAAAYPARTRTGCSSRTGFIAADGATNAYVFYNDQQFQSVAYHVFNGATRTWGNQVATMYASGYPHALLHSRVSQASVDLLTFSGTTGDVPGVRWQSITGTYNSDAWWDTVPDTGLPSGIGILQIDVACAYNPLILTWSCADRTDYSRMRADRLVSMIWTYDGIVVANRTQPGDVSFGAPRESWLHPQANHVLKVQWLLTNGEGPSATFVLQTDNRPAYLALGIAAVLVLGVIVASRRRGVLSGVWFPPTRNPDYRRTAIGVEEYPKGWKSYRQVAPRDDLPYRSERHARVWFIYQIRTATAAEQARTGKKRIAYVQTVREKM